MLRLVPIVLALLLSGSAQAPPAPPQAPSAGQVGDQLWHHRNLGKAFYENPTTQALAVEEFKKALDLAPGSARERLNYGSRTSTAMRRCATSFIEAS